MSEPKPKGSGYFSLAVGIAFVAVLLASFFVDLRAVSPQWFLRCWLGFASSIMLVWGARRIRKGRDDWTVGQETLNFVVGVVGATVAIFAIVAQQPSIGPSQGGNPPSSPESAAK